MSKLTGTALKAVVDKAAPKGKKPAKDTAKKPAGPKLVASNIKPGIGHNSNNGEKHPEVIKRIDELMKFKEQKKSIAKAERDIRNSLKSEFNILSSSVQRELALRTLDPDVRVQVETNHEDLKKMLGYQPQLDFVGGKATDASAKAQPSEAKVDRDTGPQRAKPADEPQSPAEEAQDPEEGYSVTDDAGEDEGIIEREG